MFKPPWKNQLVEIHAQKIPLGRHTRVDIPVDRLATGMEITIPVYIFNSSRPGPTVLIQACAHGDELNGTEILRRMLLERAFHIDTGCVIVLPVLNIFGFLNHTRSIHGKDVNRCYPGARRGSLARRIAYYHLHEITRNVDCVIDLHTGGEQRHNYPQIRFSQASADSYQLAKIFAPPFLFPSKPIMGSFRKQALKLGIPVVVFEGGESLRLDEFAIATGRLGILNILNSLHMLAGSPDRHAGDCRADQSISNSHGSSIELSTKHWIRAPTAGLFTSDINNGSAVSKGQLLGTIGDAYGHASIKVKAPHDGYVLSINHFPMINSGDALISLGW